MIGKGRWSANRRFAMDNLQAEPGGLLCPEPFQLLSAPTPNRQVSQAGSAPAARSSDSGSIRTPEGSPSEGGIALLCFAVPCLYLRLFYDCFLLNADEAIVLQGAQRIVQGQVLYRDFFSFFTPGSFYWMALLFKIFGSSILVGRAVLMVYGGLFSALTYLLARRVSPRWSALFACYVITLTCLPFRFLSLHNWDSTVLSYLALYCAVRWMETIVDCRLSIADCQPSIVNRRSKISNLWALGTGSFAALTFLFEHSKGAGLMLGLGGALLVLVKSKIENRKSKMGSAAYCLLPSAYCLLAGLAWPFAVTFGYFAAHRALIPMLTDWVWPVFHYSQANRLSYGYLVMSTADRGVLLSGSWVQRLATLFILGGPCILLPLLPIVALGILIGFTLKRRKDSPQRHRGAFEISNLKFQISERLCASVVNHRWAYFVLVSAVLCGLLSSTLIFTKRPDFIHLNYLAPLFYLVLAWVFEGLNVPSHLWLAVKPVVMFLIFLSYTCFGMMLLLSAPLSAHYKLETARGTVRTRNPERAIEYIQAHVTPGERIFVYPYQPFYYYLTATFSATRFDFLQPGMHTSDQLREVVAELEVNQPRVVLFEASFSEKIELIWPETPLGVIAAKDPVTDYILGHYRLCRALSANGFWHFVFMVRKGESCPE